MGRGRAGEWTEKTYVLRGLWEKSGAKARWRIQEPALGSKKVITFFHNDLCLPEGVFNDEWDLGTSSSL